MKKLRIGCFTCQHCTPFVCQHPQSQPTAAAVWRQLARCHRHHCQCHCPRTGASANHPVSDVNACKHAPQCHCHRNPMEWITSGEKRWNGYRPKKISLLNRPYASWLSQLKQLILQPRLMFARNGLINRNGCIFFNFQFGSTKYASERSLDDPKTDALSQFLTCTSVLSTP